MTETHQRIVSYIDRSRLYYQAQGYERPYRWARHSTVPFSAWADKGLSLTQAKVGVVTTSFPIGVEPPKRVYCHPTIQVPSAMYTADLAWDKEATHTDDVGSFLPLEALRTLSDEGVIGSLSDRFYGVPTSYSQSRTNRDAAQILEWAVEDHVDAIVLVPI